MVNGQPVGRLLAGIDAKFNQAKGIRDLAVLRARRAAAGGAGARR